MGKGCRPECENCDKYNEIISRCNDVVENNLHNLREQCSQTEKQVEQLKTESENKHKELQNLCFALDFKINNVKKSVYAIDFLTLSIAFIGFIICILSTFGGGGCNHADDCGCVKSCISGFGIASIVLGSLSLVFSVGIFIFSLIIKSSEYKLNSQSLQPTKSEHKKKDILSIICGVITAVNFEILLVTAFLIFFCR